METVITERGLQAVDVLVMVGIIEYCLKKFAHQQNLRRESIVMPKALTLKSSFDDFGELLSSMGSDYDYLKIHKAMKTLFEYWDEHQAAPDIAFNYCGLGTKQAQALFAATVNYVIVRNGWQEPAWASPSYARLQEVWTPAGRYEKWMSAPSQEFLRYNIVIPEGDLAWT